MGSAGHGKLTQDGQDRQPGDVHLEAVRIHIGVLRRAWEAEEKNRVDGISANGWLEKGREYELTLANPKEKANPREQLGVFL
jgi:hypothetical protein